MVQEGTRGMTRLYAVEWRSESRDRWVPYPDALFTTRRAAQERLRNMRVSLVLSWDHRVAVYTRVEKKS